MMEGLVLQNLRCVDLFIPFLFCILVLLQSYSAQEDFLSIACCSKSKFTDKSTNITWEPDDGWFADDNNCRDNTRAGLNNQDYGKARVFDIKSGKRCYSLPTIKGHEHLIRASFPSGDQLGAPPGASFGVSIGVTQISSVISSQDLVLEGIFRATDENTDFCLVHDQGEPYISKIELRPLDGLHYLNEKPSSVLKVINRTDLGGNGETRYQDDKYDRIWHPASGSSYSPAASTVSPQNSNTTVPFKVLQTALTDPSRLELIQSQLPQEYYNYSVILYFLELDATVKAGQRVFDIYLDRENRQANFDVSANGSNYKELAFDLAANGSLNLTLVKVSNGFDFGPICNAFEILQVRPLVQPTDQRDVAVMGQVQRELLNFNPRNELLNSWSGDPCLPNEWEGLVCSTNDGFTVITEMDLSSRKLRGPIPSNITDLQNLIRLDLSYNVFTGSIPPFPSTSNLTSVDVSHNDLTGLLPDALSSLPHLQALYFGCNPHLNVQALPGSFNQSKLNTDSGTCEKKSTSLSTGVVIGTAACGSFLLTLALGTIFFWYRKKWNTRGNFHGKEFPIVKNVVFSITSTDEFFKSISIQPFSLEYIEIVTQKYKTLIGEGGFGSVYRGILPDGQEVAVKVRSATSTQGTREFENELNLLSAIRHESLVPLLGYCCENDQQILVYPFMSNGSLQDRLYGEAAKRKILDWPTRLSIALGAARGLTHLHTFAGRCVIHRDVKSSNILLDHSMCAKVADFGFSKYAPQEGDSGASLEVRGTAGYLDPEYYSTQHLSTKSDVFSFGVVLLEIVSGREPLNIHRPKNEWSLVEWAKPYIRESKIEDIVDPNIKGGYHAEAMWRVVEVALACIEPVSAYRPSMIDIVRELEDALIIENNASEYMKSIDSIYSLGGSNRYPVVLEKISIPATTPATEPSQGLPPPEPR